MVNVEIKGLRELANALQQLPRKISVRMLTNSLMMGGRMIANEAKLRAPVDTGELRRNIRARPDSKRRGRYAATVIVGVRRLNKRQLAKLRTRKNRANASDPFYWRFHEFGTSKMPARPFLRPAFEARKVDAAFKITGDLRGRIAKEADALGRRGTL